MGSRVGYALKVEVEGYAAGFLVAEGSTLVGFELVQVGVAHVGGGRGTAVEIDESGDVSWGHWGGEGGCFEVWVLLERLCGVRMEIVSISVQRSWV